MNQKSNKKIYLKPEDLRTEYEKSLVQNKPTEKLIEYFYLIARRYSSKFNNLCELDTESCVSYAVSEAWQKWNKYDPERSDNCFSFYTQMLKNDLFAAHNDIKKNSHRNISIDVLFENTNKN